MISEDIVKRIQNNEKTSTIVKVFRRAYPDYLWDHAISYLSRIEYDIRLSGSSLYKEIDSLLNYGIIESQPMDVAELRNNFDSLVRRGLINSIAVTEPYAPQICYRLSEVGRRIPVLDEKKERSPGEFVFSPSPA